MLLDGINHIALVTDEIGEMRKFFATVFDAEVGSTEPHGENGDETMTTIRIGPHTELNVFTIEGNAEPKRQTPMWGRGRLDHFGLHAASRASFDTITQRLVECGASDGKVNDFGAVLSLFFRAPDGLEGEVLVAKSAESRTT